MSAHGRVAFVTGAARGLGAAIARALHEAGHDVVLADVDAAGARLAASRIDPGGVRATAVEVDVSDEEAFREAFAATVARGGRVHVLVNNAGRSATTSLFELHACEWDEVMAINLRSVFLGCRIAGEHMRAARAGRIVNVASLAGQQGGLVAGPHYAASKAGVIALTKVAARELAPYGVTVNAVAPAAIDGELLRELAAGRVDELAAGIPVGRLGRPEEVGALVAFLASDDAGYIAGATYDVNGGVFMR